MKPACAEAPLRTISQEEADEIQKSMLKSLRDTVTAIQNLGPDDPLHDAEM